MISLPRKQSETGIFKDVWRAINDLREYVRQITPISGLQTKVDQTPNGSIIRSVAVSAEAGSKVTQYRLKEVLNDLFRCREFNGTSESTADVYIAKPYKLRRTPFDGQTLAFSSDGESFSAHYVYSSATKRTSTISGTDETQIIVPRFRVDSDLIYAIECDGLNLTDPNGATVTLLDLNVDGRAFAGPAS